MRILRVILTTTSLGILLGLSPNGQANDDREAARKLQQAGEILPLETILQEAQAVQPGQVLEVEFESKRKRYIYEIEILDDTGVVHELKLDARSGELLKIEKED